MVLRKAWGRYEKGGWLSVGVFTVLKNKASFPPQQRVSPDCFGTNSPGMALSQVTRHCGVELSARIASGSNGRGTL